MKQYLRTFGWFLAAAVLAGCTKSTDVYDPQAVQQKEEQEVKKTYAESFAQKYPNTSLDQSWDFSSGQVTYSLPSGMASTRALTRGLGDYTTGSMVVEKKVYDYISSNLKDDKNNTSLGNPFYMKVPGNDFTISVIHVGRASYTWELWMSVEGMGDVKVWDKNTGVKYRQSADGAWIQTGLGLEEGIKNAYEVEAPTYTFSGLPEGRNMYFYLKVYDPGTKRTFVTSSLGQMMLTMDDCPVPASVPAGNEVMIVGCEDRPNYDQDYEDVIFMVYGKPVPPVHFLKERITTKAKRYMMEDLGTTDDFDFNDVVVDVAERTKETLVYTTDADGNEKYTGKSTTEVLKPLATVRAMGGTLDFTLKIGNTSWTKSSNFDAGTMYNTQGDIKYDAVLDEFEVDGWSYDQNNVSVTVQNKDNDGVKNIGFPKAGEAPMIIAFDPTQEWMKERQSIPEDWFTTPAATE